MLPKPVLGVVLGGELKEARGDITAKVVMTYWLLLACLSTNAERDADRWRVPEWKEWCKRPDGNGDTVRRWSWADSGLSSSTHVLLEPSEIDMQAPLHYSTTEVDVYHRSSAKGECMNQTVALHVYLSLLISPFRSI